MRNSKVLDLVLESIVFVISVDNFALDLEMRFSTSSQHILNGSTAYRCVILSGIGHQSHIAGGDVLVLYLPKSRVILPDYIESGRIP